MNLIEAKLPIGLSKYFDELLKQGRFSETEHLGQILSFKLEFTFVTKT
jgi:hypothetical protein